MNILIVKTSSLGDIIHTFPVVEYLKQCFPHGEIDWVVENHFSSLILAHPLVNRVFCIQTKKWRSELFCKATWNEIATTRREIRQKFYDLIFDLQGNSKSALVTLCAQGARKVGFGYSTVAEWPNILVTDERFNPPLGDNIRSDYLFVVKKALENYCDTRQLVLKKSVPNLGLKLTDNEEKELNRLLKKIQKLEGTKILVCPGSNWPNKQLSLATLKTFFQCLSQTLNVCLFFIWGDEKEKKIAETLSHEFPNKSSVIEKLSIPVLQHLMGKVDLVIGMDSLPLHLAGTTSTPTYSIFGPSWAHRYKPLGDRHGAFQGSCPYGQSFTKRCALLRTCKTGACLKELEGQHLFDQFYFWYRALQV